MKTEGEWMGLSIEDGFNFAIGQQLGGLVSALVTIAIVVAIIAVMWIVWMAWDSVTSRFSAWKIKRAKRRIEK